MTNFEFKARDKYGVLTSGRLDADSSRGVALQLTKLGFTPISIAAVESSSLSISLDQLIGVLKRVSVEEIIVFTRQLSSILEAGVPLTDGLDAVAEQVVNKKFRSIILQTRKDIEGGSTMSDAFKRYPKTFSPLIINMIRSGEKAGLLPQVLDRISALLEKEVETKDKITSATRYPLIVLVSLGLAFVVLTMYVIPKFAGFFAAFKAELPLPTRLLIWFNYALTTYWYWAVGLIAVAVYSAKKVLDTEIGRYRWDGFMLSTPVFGPLYSKINLSRFGRMLASMLGSGIPILEALTITADTVDNKVISRVIRDVRNDISQGKSLAEPMKGSGVFPPIAVSMVAIGEKAGTLETMLTKMADYFDREVDYTIKNLTPLIEPVLILGLGVILLIFALGIFLPMWDLIKVYKT